MATQDPGGSSDRAAVDRGPDAARAGSRARTVGGTGLGLAIAMEDANLHGGWLTAWGRPGLGAQFRLTLPRRADEPVTHSPLPLVPEDLLERDARAPSVPEEVS